MIVFAAASVLIITEKNIRETGYFAQVLLAMISSHAIQKQLQMSKPTSKHRHKNGRIVHLQQ